MSHKPIYDFQVASDGCVVVKDLEGFKLTLI